MQSSGWKPGTALGASSIPAHESTAAQVKIAVKDNMLGLGASLKSRNVEYQRTGLDAFQGLLGRLNAKDAAELEKVEAKIENKKLVMFAQGKWGGMVFVPGGLLVQEDPTKLKPIKSADVEMADKAAESESEDESDAAQKPEKKRKREGETSEERADRKAEKRQRKEEKRAKKEAKRLKKLQSMSGTDTPTTDVEVTSGTSTPSILRSGTSTPLRTETMRNGRHLLRGRNIQAKRAAFSDAKGLDQIFMRQQQTA